MPTSVKIIKDSTNWLNKRLTTWILDYPRYIHSELMTHRVFSKNSASSRAIPYLKMVQNIRDNMVMPIWTENKAGMQGDIITNQMQIDKANEAWKYAFDSILKPAHELNHFIKIHKQNINRLIEPWMHIRVILTGTDFDNWYTLRAHKDAQPEIQQLAYMMKDAHDKSVPTLLQPGEWHIPFGDNITEEAISEQLAKENDNLPLPYSLFTDRYKINLKTSVARCARISHNNVDGSSSTVDKDIELFDKLIVSEPLHASPAEHQAQVPTFLEIISGDFDSKWEYDYNTKQAIFDRGRYVSNLQGWKQLRKVIEAKEF